jgi:hypothetical protein
MKFQTTTGSLYEVDAVQQKVRRLSGVKDPQPRQGKDGEWRAYVDLQLKEGKCAVIFWDPATTPLLEGSPAGATPTTITSVVLKIEE